MYQNHDPIMPNQKSTASRTLAFWLGLTLHLALGAALYRQVTDRPAAQIHHATTAEQAAATLPTP